MSALNYKPMLCKSTVIPGLLFAALMILMFVVRVPLTYVMWTVFFIVLNWLMVALYSVYLKGKTDNHLKGKYATHPIIQFGKYFCLSLVFNFAIIGTCVLFGLRLNLDNLVFGLLAYSFLYSLSAALFEEILFRGLILGALLRILPARGRIPLAIFLQAIPFILSHTKSLHVNSFIVSLICFSILSGIFAVYTRALWLSIAFHCAWNFSDMVIYGLKYRRLPHYLGIGEFDGNHTIYGAAWLVFLLTCAIAIFVRRKKLGECPNCPLCQTSCRL